ncbi:MAG: Arc family DNA-binding protein [Hyphomicrobiales bacterium]|nr:MAG: Arc family DNA-binding protein [Hyphomicrobiales bacterium]
MKSARVYPRYRAQTPEEKKEGPLAFRPPPDLKKRLVEAAEANGRTVSSEIERRLEHSLWREGEPQDIANEAAGGAHNRALAFLIQRVAVGVEHECGRSWKDDPKVFAEVATSIVFLLQSMGAFHGATMPLPMKGKHLTDFDPLWHVPMHSLNDAPDGPVWLFVAGLLKSQVEVGNLAWPLTPAMKPGGAKAQARSEMPPLDVLQTIIPERKATPRRTAQAFSKAKEKETPE